MLKYHKKNFLFFVFAINIFSNLLLNISLSLLPEKSINIYTGELFVIIFEFFAFLFFLKTNAKNSLRLFLMTVSSNLISYFAGLIFYNILGIL